VYSDGGDSWSWVTANPAPYSGTVAHQSAIAAGLHEHYFDWANATLEVAAGDSLYSYVYLDPVNLPSEIMLHWNDGSSEHRAYWGANNIPYCTDGTASRRYMGALPAAGQWVRVQVPASAVALEGSTLKGMTFSVYNGRATWDYAGKSSATNSSSTLPTVSVTTANANASRVGPVNGTITLTRAGDTTSALPVSYILGGTAVNGVDYNTLSTTSTIPAGVASTNITITPKITTNLVGASAVTLTLSANSAYTIGAAATAKVAIAGNSLPSSLANVSGNNLRLTWASRVGGIYHVAYKNNLTDALWIDLSGIIAATSTSTSWTDPTAALARNRFYVVYAAN